MRTAIVAALLTLAACSNGGKDAPPRRDDATTRYLRELDALQAKETEARAALEAVTGAHYTDDAAILAALDDTALPRWKELVDGLTALTPPPGRLAPLHTGLIDLARRELDLLHRLRSAISHGDGTTVLLINQSQRQLEQDRSLLHRQFRDGI